MQMNIIYCLIDKEEIITKFIILLAPEIVVKIDLVI